MVQCKRNENEDYSTVKNCPSITGQRILTEELKNKFSAGKAPEKGVITKCPTESWIPNSKEATEWGNLNFGGWMLW
jgi:hypothetical protein